MKKIKKMLYGVFSIKIFLNIALVTLIVMTCAECVICFIVKDNTIFFQKMLSILFCLIIFVSWLFFNFKYFSQSNEKDINRNIIIIFFTFLSGLILGAIMAKMFDSETFSPLTFFLSSLITSAIMMLVGILAYFKKDDEAKIYYPD